MAVTAAVLVNEGFETMEALAPVDLLRRAGVKLTIASAREELMVTSGQSVSIKCDALLKDVKDESFDVLIVPGGLPNAELLGADENVKHMLTKQSDRGGWIASICASPACVLAANGFLKDAKAVCYPAEQFHKLMGSSLQENSDVHIDEPHKILTARGPANAVAFGEKILTCLGLREQADSVMKGMLFK